MERGAGTGNLSMKFNRLLAKWRLIRRYKYITEVDRLMEEYLTEQIMNGGSDEFIADSRRKLIDLQNGIVANQTLINFLKRSK